MLRVILSLFQFRELCPFVLVYRGSIVKVDERVTGILGLQDKQFVSK